MAFARELLPLMSLSRVPRPVVVVARGAQVKPAGVGSVVPTATPRLSTSPRTAPNNNRSTPSRAL